VVKTSPTFNERCLGVFAVSAASTLEGGTTPPTELTTPAKVTFAIKLNTPSFYAAARAASRDTVSKR
jgi:hypothetical protein